MFLKRLKQELRDGERVFGTDLCNGNSYGQEYKIADDTAEKPDLNTSFKQLVVGELNRDDNRVALNLN